MEGKTGGGKSSGGKVYSSVKIIGKKRNAGKKQARLSWGAFIVRTKFHMCVFIWELCSGPPTDKSKKPTKQGRKAFIFWLTVQSTVHYDRRSQDSKVLKAPDHITLTTRKQR